MRAFGRAQRFLATLVEQLGERRESRLPSLSVLAARAGVSRGVMSRAVSLFREKGIVRTRPGSGIWRVCAELPDRLSDRPDGARLRWQATRDAILGDILGGRHPRGSRLPGKKELCARYDVANRTLNKALGALKTAGLVHRENSRWYAGGGSGRERKNALLFFAVGDWYGNLEESTPQVRRNFEELERLCAAENIELVSCLCRRHPGGRLVFDESVSGMVDALERQGRLLGSVVFTLNLRRKPMQVLYSLLSRYRLPVAFFNESGDCGRREVVGAPCLNVEYDNVAAGRHVGQFLLERGYREVAWVAEWQDARYCRDRLKGVHEAFSGAGLAGAVHTFTEDDTVRRYVDTTGLVGFTIAERIFRQARTDYRPSAERSAPIKGQFKQQVDKLRKLIATHEQSRPTLERMAREVPAMPWVAANDILALECMEFRSAREPRPAVIGFDDTPEAARCSLTSYNFGGTHAMRAVLNHCLEPLTARLAAARAARPVQVAGYVVPRGSVPYADAAALR